MTTPDAAAQAMPRKRLGDVLVDEGVLTNEDVEAVLAHQKTIAGPRRKLGELLVELNFCSERDIAEALASQLNLAMIDLSQRPPDPEMIRALPQKVSERHSLLMIDREGSTVVVTSADPTNVLALDDVKLHTGATDLIVCVSTASQIKDHMARAFSLGADTAGVESMVKDMGEEDDSNENLVGAASEDDAPIVKLVNRILADAVRLRCSDIHVETQRDVLRVRYRVDGILRDVMKAPKRAAGAVISRIKIVSGLDIAERRIPQDGRSRIIVGGSAIDCRVSTLPALHGEKVVIRLLTRGDDVPSLESLGFEPAQLEVFRRSLGVPQGLVLITGPTGSGKTNTLYAGIHEISDPEKNIITLEDPVEVQLPGITQVQVNVKAGMTFERGLRSVLRQDPDIVLVGEVRDKETAELALKASITGHLVLTTLHTNSAVAALTRLVDMGAEPFLVASSLTCAIAQRLVRTPCENCAEGYIPDERILDRLGLTIEDILDATPLKGRGCDECGGTGYRGRTAVYEVLEVDRPLREILMKDPSETAISAQAKSAGMQTLRQSALTKAMRGDTTFEEALRVTQADAEGGKQCPQCSEKVGVDFLVCPFCEFVLHVGDCSGCGRRLDPTWKLCPFCRTRTPTGGQPVQPAGNSTDLLDAEYVADPNENEERPDRRRADRRAQDNAGFGVPPQGYAQDG
ncbi:MAG: general secretion pathway protein GspE [Micrococcales bacterium]|nr:MAG: general secretion pathway protein GspE [Micrococcales bacterium]